jgi:hypothetical protein
LVSTAWLPANVVRSLEYLDLRNHAIEQVRADIADHQIGTRLEKRDRFAAIHAVGRAGDRRRLWRATGGIDAAVVDLVGEEGDPRQAVDGSTNTGGNEGNIPPPASLRSSSVTPGLKMMMS